MSVGPPPPTRERWRWTGWVLGVLGTVVLLALLLSRVNGASMVDALHRTDPGLLVAAVIISLVVRLLLQSDRWRRILLAMGSSVSMKASIFVNVASYPLQFGTPGKAGLLLSALWVERRYGVHASEGLSAFGLPRLQNLLCLLCFGILGSLAIPVTRAPRAGGSFVLQATLALGALLAVVALTFALRRPLQAGLERVSTRLARWVGGLLASITKLPLGVQLAILAYSAFILVLELSGVYLLHRAVHLDIGYLHFMLGASLAIIVGNLPITVGGFGSREAVLMMVFTQVGSSETVLSAGLLWSAIFYLLPVLVGLPLVTLMFRQLARDRRSEAGV